MPARKPRFIKVEGIFPYGTIFDVDSLETLTKRFRRIYETPEAYFGISRDAVFRVKKEGFKPTLRKVDSVYCNPELNKVHLKKETLFDIACDMGNELLETDDAFLMLTPNLVFISKKVP